MALEYLVYDTHETTTDIIIALKCFIEELLFPSKHKLNLKLKKIPGTRI